MKVVQTCSSTPLVKSASKQRNWNPARLQLATSSKPPGMYRQPKLTFYVINILNYHKRRRKVTNENTSNPKTANYHTRNILIHHRLMAARIVAPNVVIPGMHKAFPVQQRNICGKACKKYGHFTSLCFSKQKKTAYQITAEEMENNSESEMDDDPYSNDSFILYQMRAKINKSTAQ